MNELKLFLYNFQSISEGELVFKTGLNFIIGQSNSGKSATFRAVKACLLNPSGSQRFIKKDTNKTIVELKYNGNDICWNKTGKANSYTINGEEYRNTGKSDAFKILNNETGFVKAEKGCALMNIEEELQLPFPFGIPDSELFKLFENVFCVSDSAVILKSAKDHEDKVKDDISLLELEEAKVQNKINCLNTLKKEVNIEVLKGYKDTLKRKENKLDTLKDGLSVIKLACKVVKSNLKIEERDFRNLFEQYSNALECKEVFNNLIKLHNLSKNLRNVQIYSSSNLGQLADLQNLKELSKTTQILKKLHKVKVKEVSFENKLQELRELRTIRSYIDKIKGEVQELKANKKREEEKVASIEVKLKEFKVCPLCHHSLEKNKEEKC